MDTEEKIKQKVRRSIAELSTVELEKVLFRAIILKNEGIIELCKREQREAVVFADKVMKDDN